MFRRIRSLIGALAVAALVAGHAAPAAAGTLDTVDRNSMHPLVDLVLLRPFGLAATAAGVVAFPFAAAATAIVRPDDVGKTFDYLVMQPVQYTFLDPLGSHGGRGR